MKIWKVAIYARVSTDKKEQSESIPAQVDGLKKWLIEKSRDDKENIYNLVEVYEDQGFSGSNFERDSFIRMKEDIDKGKINMVLTRDLSRFSRNYILAGYYLEDYFKVNGVRFVSVLDNVDSESEFDDIIPFKNILNEMYIKDCSKKIRDALKQRMLRGSSIASKPPYGYDFSIKYDGNVKTITLVPAQDGTAEIVKQIFDLYLKGFGVEKIANHLNEKLIPPPSAKINNFGKVKYGLWSGNTILSILKNPKYGGYMVQHRYKKVSYKVKKINKVEEEKWIWSGEFEGIIEKEIFNRCQVLLRNRKKARNKNGELHLFSTVLQCGECGGSMCYRKNYGGYKCTNSQKGGRRCTAHSIKEEFLTEVISLRLRELIVNIDREELYIKWQGSNPSENNNEKELVKIVQELNRLDLNFQKVYEDKLNGTLNERNFINISRAIEDKQKSLINKKVELESKIRIKNKEDNETIYKKYIDSILDFKEWDREMVEDLIDKIVVCEKKEEKRILIYFAFLN